MNDTAGDTAALIHPRHMLVYDTAGDAVLYSRQRLPLVILRYFLVTSSFCIDSLYLIGGGMIPPVILCYYACSSHTRVALVAGT